MCRYYTHGISCSKTIHMDHVNVQKHIHIHKKTNNTFGAHSEGIMVLCLGFWFPFSFVSSRATKIKKRKAKLETQKPEHQTNTIYEFSYKNDIKCNKKSLTSEIPNSRTKSHFNNLLSISSKLNPLVSGT